MRRVDEDWSACLGIDPPGLRPTARKDKRVNFSVFAHAELQIAIEWRARYRLPVEQGRAFKYVPTVTAPRMLRIATIAQVDHPRFSRRRSGL
jgi:hypothetical protein